MFEKMKEIEDLKSELDAIQTGNSERFKIEKKRIIDEVKGGFKELFLSNSFLIDEVPVNHHGTGVGSKLTSSYKGLNFILNVPSVDDGFFGAITVFEFIADKKKWIIAVNDVMSKGLGWTVSTGNTDEIANLKKQIEDAKKRAQRLETQHIEYELTYYVEGNKTNSSSADRISEVIRSILDE